MEVKCRLNGENILLRGEPTARGAVSYRLLLRA